MRIAQHHETTVKLDKTESPVMQLHTSGLHKVSVRVTEVRRMTTDGSLWRYAWQGFKVRRDGADGQYLTGHSSVSGTTNEQFEAQLDGTVFSALTTGV